MNDVSMLKFLGELFYLIVALCALCGLWDLFRTYRTINSTALKTRVTAYELQKLLEGRPR